MKLARATAIVLAFSFAIPLVAAADDTVIVLGVRSMEGDDDFALSVTGALRHGAAQVPGWDVSEREVSLAQMALAHGCDDPDVACMQQIADTLGVERVVYGTVRRTSTEADFNYTITLYMFNARAGEIEGSMTDQIPRSQSDIDQFRARVEGYIAQLSGTERGGTLRVTTNVSGAEVYVDDQLVGTASADGQLTIDVASGPRRVEVRADGYSTFRGTVTVAAGAGAEIEANLVEGSGVSGGGGADINWAGVGLLAVGAAAAVWTIYSWLAIQSANNDEAFDEYRRMVPTEGSPTATLMNGNGDACEAHEKGNRFAWSDGDPRLADVESICDKATSFFFSPIFQVITAVVALGGIGTGLYLLFADDGVEEEPEFTLSPSIGPRGASLAGTLRF